MAAPVPVIPRLSAATLLLRPHPADGDIEVFMVRRHDNIDFAPGVYVFPGGSVCESDREAEVTPGVCVPNATLSEDTALGTGVRIAAIRELFEEAGVLLASRDESPLDPSEANGERLTTMRAQIETRSLSMAECAAMEDLVFLTDSLVHYAHWITPEAFPKRFDTHFFLALHPAGQSAIHDMHETVEGLWIRPHTALARHEAGDFPLVFATVHHLRGLLDFATPEEALTAWRGQTPTPIMPRAVYQNGQEIILMPGEPEPFQ